jgi:hypothetical protein
MVNNLSVYLLADASFRPHNTCVVSVLDGNFCHPRALAPAILCFPRYAILVFYPLELLEVITYYATSKIFITFLLGTFRHDRHSLDKQKSINYWAEIVQVRQPQFLSDSILNVANLKECSGFKCLRSSERTPNNTVTTLSVHAAEPTVHEPKNAQCFIFCSEV